MINVGDSVLWTNKDGLQLRGSVVEVGEEGAEATQLKVKCVSSGPFNDQIVLLTTDQVQKEGAAPPEVGATPVTAAAVNGSQKKESFFARSPYLLEETLPDVVTTRYVTSPDPADGHTHYVDLDMDGDGTTDPATGPQSYTHTHGVVDGVVMPTSEQNVVSTHPGDLSKVGDEVDAPVVPDEEPTAPMITTPSVVTTTSTTPGIAAVESHSIYNGLFEVKSEATKAEEEKKKKASKKDVKGEDCKKESYVDYLNSVIWEEEDPVDDKEPDEEPEPELPPEEDEEDEPEMESLNDWDGYWLGEDEGAKTPIAPTADELTTKGGGDNQAVDPKTTTAVPGPEQTTDPLDKDDPASTSAGREVEGEQPLPAGADMKKTAVESAVRKVMRGVNPSLAVRQLIAETSRF